MQDIDRIGNVYPGPSGSRPLDRASSYTNIFDGSPQSNMRNDFFKKSSAQFVSCPATMPEAVPTRYSSDQQELVSSLSLSRPHSWPGTTACSQNLALNPRYGTSDKTAEHVHLVDFLSLPESRGHGRMGTSVDGIQLDLTMATGPASEDDQSAQSSHSKSKVDLDLTLDLSMSTRWRLSLSVQVENWKICWSVAVTFLSIGIISEFNLFCH